MSSSPTDPEPGGPATGSGELTALAKHSCPACGAQAEWQPAKQILACAFCGTESPYEVDQATGQISEIDLVKTLREMPQQLRGWRAETSTVRCRSCKAVSVFEIGRVGQNCDFCGSPELVDYEEVKAPIRPQSLLPFKVDESGVRDSIKSWFGSKWFAPSRLKRKAAIDTVRGVYLPYWTFDAQAHCPWTADSGTYYYTTESYTDKDGNRKTRQKRRVRWTPASGFVEHFFDDTPVPATHGVDSELLRRVEPFPTGDLLLYDTAFLSGFVVEHYQVVLIDAAKQSRGAMEAHLRSLCASRVPGDTHRNLQIVPSYSGETFKHILVPVWLLAYDFRGDSFQVLINGSTGEIAGRYPKSFWKIFSLILAGLLAVLVIVLLTR